MSRDEDKTKEQLIEELEALRRRVAEEELLVLQHNLRERVKELTCLHRATQLMAKPGISLEEVSNGVVDLITHAWQYPEITCARIIFGGKEFKMDNFRSTEWKQSSDIKSNGETVGTLEVYYLEEKPEAYEGPFLKEERALIEDIAQELGNFAERKEMEEELRNSGEKYRAIFHEARDGIALLDGNKGYIVDCNPEFEKQTGRRLKQLKKMRMWDIRPSEMREAGKEAFYTGRSKGEGHCPEPEFQKPNGEIVHLECVSKRIKVRSRDYIQCITRDMGERKQAEERLRKSKAFTENLIASMKDGFSVLDNQSVHLNVNEALCHMTGFTREELIGVGPPHPYWPEEEYEEIQKAFQKTLRGEFADFELIFKRKNGERFPVIVSPSWLRDEEGNVISYFATIKDITKRKQVEESVRREKDKAQKYLDVAEVMIIVVDADQKVNLINKKGCQILGYREEEIVGKNWFDFFLAERYRSKRSAVFRKLMSGKIKQVEYFENPVLTKSGEERAISWHNSVLTDGAGNIIGALGSGEDITERKRAEQKLNEYHVHLEDLVKKRTAELEEQIKRRITYTRALVHELKTPLTAIVASSELLIEQLKDEPGPRLARNIYRGACNLDRRIDELLDLARSEIGTLELECESVDPSGLIHDVSEDMSVEAAKKGQSLVLAVPTSLPLIWADEERLRQILLNLISNALKFNRKGGRVSLRAGEKDAHVVFEVRDEGEGIADEDQERLFQPYHRLESDRERFSGLGLGLALCKTLVELHQGQIWVKSQKGKGSTFGFSIPLKVTAQLENGAKA